MKKIFFLLVASLCTFCFVHAQNPNLKWGKPSQTEWSLQAWGEAPDAGAVILCKTMDVNYQISRQFSSFSDVSTELSVANLDNLGNSENKNVVVNYENKVRVKILQDSGIGYANVDIVYLSDEKDSKIYDELENLKVVVYSLNEKGKVKKRYIQNNTFTTDRLDPHYKVLHVRIPDAQKGDIIEYQYNISSTRVTFLYDCSFQEEIPVLYAKCDMNIPGFIQFNMQVPIHPFIKSKVDQGMIHAEQAGGDMSAPKSYPSNHYVIEGHDILPKGLDLQRNDPNVEAAKVSTDPAKILRTEAMIKGPASMAPVAMPKGKNHLTFNPK